MRSGGVSNCSVVVFLSHRSKNAVGEHCSLSLISVIEKVRTRELGGGVSRFSVQIVLSHSAEKFRRVTLLCCVSENLC